MQKYPASKKVKCIMYSFQSEITKQKKRKRNYKAYKETGKSVIIKRKIINRSQLTQLTQMLELAEQRH